MKTKAVRLYGKFDLRLDTFDLPALGAEELLVRIVSDSICMSSYKASELGTDHKRVPKDIAENPIIIGHEFCGEILELGSRVESLYPARYRVGMKFAVQTAMKGTYDAAGYSFRYLGGAMQIGIVPACYLEQNNILPFEGAAFFFGSLAEPLSCVIGAAHANYHTEHGSYLHKMEIKPGGNMAILAGAGPMGFGLIDYMLQRAQRPGLLVVTDIDSGRLARAAEIFPVERAAARGITLVYLNANEVSDPVAVLRELSGGSGFDDVFVFAPIPAVIAQGDGILAYDGCLNFFAGPTDPTLTAPFNFYNVHYNSTHLVGTSGGNTDDMLEALALCGKGLLTPATLVTHIGGLDAVADTTNRLPDIPGCKKLIYTHIALPLTAIADFAKKGKTDPLFQKLDEICSAHNGLWNPAAEEYLLTNAQTI